MNTNLAPVLIGVADKQPMALHYALAECVRLRRPLRVVHCWALPAAAPEFYVGPDAVEAIRTDAEAVLADARQVVAEVAPTVNVEYVIVDGAPANALRQEAEQAALLVLGSDDVPWLDRLLGGEVSGYLARTAACPVVVVPERDVAATGGVVVTVDGDTPAAGPLLYGFEQADARREPLRVLHAAPGATVREDFENHQANVAEVMAGWQERFPDVSVIQSTTESALTSACAKATAEASLAVFGRHHGRSTPFTRARPIAMAVLRTAQCPVAVVPLDYGRL